MQWYSLLFLKREKGHALHNSFVNNKYYTDCFMGATMMNIDMALVSMWQGKTREREGERNKITSTVNNYRIDLKC